MNRISSSLRRLGRQPGSTIGLTVSLALVTAVSTALFSVFDGALFRPLPFKAPDAIVHLHVPYERLLIQPDLFEELPKVIAGLPLSELTFVQRQTSLEQGEVVASEFESRPVFVSSAFFRLLGIAPVLGQPFVEADADTRPRRAVLSYSLWQTQFNSDPSILARTVVLPGMTSVPGGQVVVAGVMPPGFEFPHGANVWLPYTPRDFRPAVVPDFARLEGTATVETIRSALPGVEIVPLRQYLRPAGARAVGLLLANTILLLFVTWTQIGGVIFTRTFDRASEYGVRLALGATRKRLIQDAALEGALVVTASLAVSWMLVRPLTHLTIWVLPWDITAGLDLTPNWRAFAFSSILYALALLIGVTVAANIIIRIASPVRTGPNPLYQRRGAVGLRFSMFVLQIGLTTTLAILTAASFRSFAAIQRIDLGFEPHGLFAFALPLANESAPSARSAEQLQMGRVSEALHLVRALPGVKEAALAGSWPMATAPGRRLVRLDDSAPDMIEIQVRRIGIGYPTVVGARLIAGREATAEEARPETQKGRLRGVGLANRSLARRLEHRGPVIGQDLALSPASSVRIVGVLNDVEDRILDGVVRPTIYPYVPNESLGLLMLARLDAVTSPAVVHAGLDAVFGANREARQVVSVADVAWRAGSNHRSRSVLMGMVTALCIPVTVAGIMSSVGYTIRRRSKEFAIRLAIGASHEALQIQVLLVTIAGAAVGIAAGSFTGAWIVSGVAGTLTDVVVDVPLAFLTGLCVLLVVAATAAYAMTALKSVSASMLLRATES